MSPSEQRPTPVFPLLNGTSLNTHCNPVLVRPGAPMLMVAFAILWLGAVSHVHAAVGENDPVRGYLNVVTYSGRSLSQYADENVAGANTTALQNALDHAAGNDMVAFFPVGTYYVNDTLECAMVRYKGQANIEVPRNVLVGSVGGPSRPLIKLAANAPSFDNAGGKKPAVHYMMDFIGSENDGIFNDSKSMFYAKLQGIDIDCSGHQGAVGLQFDAAQDCVIADCKVTATGAFAAFYGIPSRAAGAVNIEAEGGQYGIYHIKEGSSPNGLNSLAGATVAGAILRHQTQSAIYSDGFAPLVVVGFEIESAATATAAVRIPNGTKTAFATLNLIDGVITANNSAATAVLNTLDPQGGRNLYLRNVYVTGTDKLVESDPHNVVTSTGEWKRIDEYSHCHLQSYGSGGNTFVSYNLIGGSLHQNQVVSITPSAGPPPADLRSRHAWASLPSVEDADVYVPTAAELPSGDADVRNQLQSLIDAHDKLYIPPGLYRIGAPGITLRAESVVFGAGRSLTVLRTHGDWNPTSPATAVTTESDPEAITYLGDLSVAVDTFDLNHAWFTALDWKAGRNSTVNIGRFFSANAPGNNKPGAHAANPVDFFRVSGNGGGRWYFTGTFERERNDHPDFRQFRVTGTTQPLWIYGLNLEHSRGDSFAEFNNSANIRIYCLKTEHGGAFSNDTGVEHNPFITVADTANFALFGHGAIRGAPGAGRGIFQVKSGSSGILATAIVPQTTDSAFSAGDTLRDFIDGQSLDYPRSVALYRRGSLNDAAMTHDSVSYGPPPSSNVTFTSIAAEDGYAMASWATATDGGVYGIRAGESGGGAQYKGVLSFDTAALPDNAVITSAKLRLRQAAMKNDPFSNLGACTVDVRSGVFGSDAALAAEDFAAAATAGNVGQVAGAANGAWVEISLNAAGVGAINSAGRTQFRIQFPTGGPADQFVGWHPGEAAGDEPQLVLEYDLPEETFVTVAAEDGYATAGWANAADTGGYGIRAGENANGNQSKGILSFDTSSLPDNAQVVSATLRLRQSNMTGTPFQTLGACLVDISNGSFGSGAALDPEDFDAVATATGVGQVIEVANGAWVNVSLNAAGRNAVNPSGRTQLRIGFPASAAANHFVGWNPGETAGYEPQLVLQYEYEQAQNTPPTISAIADQTIDEDGDTGALAVTVGDVETAAGSLTLSGTSSDTALVPNENISFGSSGANRTVTVTPAADQYGTATITVTVSDGTVSAPASFLLTVNSVNDAPTITALADQNIAEDGNTGAIAFTVGDVETTAGSLTLSGTSSDSALVPNGNISFGGSGANRTVTVTPAADQFGSATITVTVSDGTDSAPSSFLLTVNSVNDAPTITAIADQTIAEDGNTGSLAFTVGDVETAAGSLTLSGSSSDTALVPNGNIIFGGSGANRTVTVTPAADQYGTATITVTVSDGTDSVPSSFLLTVNAVNDAPTITAIADQTIDEDGNTGSLAFTVGDVETAAGSLTLSGSSSDTALVPNGNIIFGGSGANRTVSVTPAADQFGTATITVTVSDGTDSAPSSFLLTVNSVNDAPTITAIADQTIDEDGNTGALAFTVGDVETAAGSLTLSGTSSDTTLVPNGNIMFGGSGANRTVTVTPAADQYGTATITVTVSDGTDSAPSSFLLTVNAVNDAPTITAIADQTIDEDGNTGAIAFTVGDVETAAGSLTLSGTSSDTSLVPNGNISFGGSGANRTVMVTPTADQYGVATITVTVSDGTDTAPTSFLLTVNSVNDLPTASLDSPAEGSVFEAGMDISLTASASDPDGAIDRVEFYVGSTLLGSDTTSPYQWSWQDAPSGAFALTAVAVDDQGGSRQSSVVNVTLTLPSPWQHTDIGNVGFAGDAEFDQGTFTVTASGTQIWNTSDEFHFVHQSLHGDGEITARIASHPTTPVFAKAGVMVRESLAGDAAFAHMILHGQGGARLQYRSVTGTNVVNSGGSGTAETPPHWVRISRAGTQIRGYHSADGLNWTEIAGSPVTVHMAADIEIGLALTSHDNSVAVTSTFTDVEVVPTLPTPWSSQDIGPVGVAGGSSHFEGVFEVRGAGTDILHGNDEFHYLFQPASGDCSITARVKSLENTAQYPKAGLMIRESTASNARWVHLYELNPALYDGSRLRVRPDPGGNSTVAGSTATANSQLWLRLVRTGNSFAAYESTDGSNWSPVGSPTTVAMTQNVLIGLSVVSFDNAVLNTSEFDNVSVSP